MHLHIYPREVFVHCCSLITTRPPRGYRDIKAFEVMKIVYIVIMFVFPSHSLARLLACLAHAFFHTFRIRLLDVQLNESRYFFFSLINSAVPDVGIFLL